MKQRLIKIKQQPVTANMTPEQLREYKEAVREAQHGNASNIWDIVPGHGFSGKVSAKTMSDDLNDAGSKHNDSVKRVEDYWIMNAHSDKAEQIRRWSGNIKELQEQVKKITNDQYMDRAEKEKKIKIRLNIITDLRDSIRRANEYLERKRQLASIVDEKLGIKTK